MQAPAGTATCCLPHSQLCHFGWSSLSLRPREAGVPNELINVGEALGDPRLKGAQYMQIRVIVITHNYGVSAGEIIQKRTMSGPAEGLPRSVLQWWRNQATNQSNNSLPLPPLLPFLPPNIPPSISFFFPFLFPPSSSFFFSLPSSHPSLFHFLSQFWACCPLSPPHMPSLSFIETGAWHHWKERLDSIPLNDGGNEGPRSGDSFSFLLSGSLRGFLNFFGCETQV